MDPRHPDSEIYYDSFRTFYTGNLRITTRLRSDDSPQGRHARRDVPGTFDVAILVVDGQAATGIAHVDDIGLPRGWGGAVDGDDAHRTAGEAALSFEAAGLWAPSEGVEACSRDAKVEAAGGWYDTDEGTEGTGEPVLFQSIAEYEAFRA